MPKYRIEHKTQGVGTIEAARYEQNGAGTFFYDETGAQIASFYDGEIRSVRPDSVIFGAAPAGGEA